MYLVCRMRCRTLDFVLGLQQLDPPLADLTCFLVPCTRYEIAAAAGITKAVAVALCAYLWSATATGTRVGPVPINIYEKTVIYESSGGRPLLL